MNNALDKAYRRLKWALIAFCIALVLYVGEHIYFTFIFTGDISR